MNTIKKSRIYSKTTKTSMHPILASPKRNGEAIKILKEDDIHAVLTADKGVALVVTDKSSYVDK